MLWLGPFDFTEMLSRLQGFYLCSGWQRLCHTADQLDRHRHVSCAVYCASGDCRCQAQLLETEASLSKLREQQRHAEERSTHGQAQLGMMNDLLQLLQTKQQLAAAAAAANSPSKATGHDVLLSAGRWAPAAGPAAANVMVL